MVLVITIGLVLEIPRVESIGRIHDELSGLGNTKRHSVLKDCFFISSLGTGGVGVIRGAVCNYIRKQRWTLASLRGRVVGVQNIKIHNRNENLTVEPRL